MRARDLQEGMMIDGEPIVRWLMDNGYMDDDTVEAHGMLIHVENEYCEVETVEIEKHKVTGEDLAVVYTWGGNWAIPADFDVDVVEDI